MKQVLSLHFTISGLSEKDLSEFLTESNIVFFDLVSRLNQILDQAPTSGQSIQANYSGLTINDPRVELLVK